MRRPIQWLALSALLVAPAGLLVAQPAQDDLPAAGERTAPFAPGDWRPGPAFVEGPADIPRDEQDVPLAPQGWVADEDSDQAVGPADVMDEGGLSVEIGGGTEPSAEPGSLLGPDGLHPLATMSEDAEVSVDMPGRPGELPDEVRIVGPDGLSEGTEDDPMNLGQDGQPLHAAPDGVVSEPGSGEAQTPERAGSSEAAVQRPGEAVRATGLRELRDYVAIRTKPLFAPDRSPPRMPEPTLPPEPVLAEPELPPLPPAEEEIVLETVPDWELVGMVRSNRLHSAMFRKFGEADSFSLRRGESRDGWTLDEIGRFEVVLRNDQGQARLTFAGN